MNIKTKYEIGTRAIKGLPRTGFNESNFASMPDYCYLNCNKRLFDCDYETLILELKKYKENESSLEQLEKYVLNLKKNITAGIGLYLSGPSGIGKSTILTHIIKLCDGFYFDTVDLLGLIKQGWHNEDITSFLDYIIFNSSILAIDDFGVLDYKAQSEDMRHLVGIFVRRYNSMKPVIFSSNHPVSFFNDSFIQSRLQDYVQINLIGKDLRGGSNVL